jgi:hypothetical protein
VNDVERLWNLHRHAIVDACHFGVTIAADHPNLGRWKIIETPQRLDVVHRIIGFQKRLALSAGRSQDHYRAHRHATLDADRWLLFWHPFRTAASRGCLS